MKRTITIALLCMLCGSCTHKRQQTDAIYVSIAPLRPVVERIVGDDFPIAVLVPAGASPETFEPTPRQVVALGRAPFVFSVGLIDFERALLGKMDDKSHIVDLSNGINLIAGSCSHNHHGHHCSHGIDPHIWCSPKCLITMADNAFNAIHAAMPDSVKYEVRYRALRHELEALDEKVAQICDNSAVNYFIINHPALTYIARDYGIEQIALEHEGKESSVKRIATIISRARKDNVQRVFYQSTFPRSSVEAVCDDLGAEAVEINPLDENIFENIPRMVSLITAKPCERR